MDPLSIASGCAGLITAIGGLSVKIHSFVRTCREARGDLDSVSRELLSLQTILELIKEDASDESKPFPKTLNQHVTAILGNCNLVVTEIQTCITKYSQDRLKTRVAWAINGQGDINKLRSSLEAHKTALEIGLDMLALHLTKEIKNDTTEIRNDTAAIKEDTTQILEEIARLQARLPRDAAAAASNDFILQRFFEEMTTYTEKALDAARSDVDANSSKALSFDEGLGEHTTALVEQNSWPYHPMPSSSKQTSRTESWISSQIQNPYRDSEATSDTSFPTLTNEGHEQREDSFDQPQDIYGEDADKNASTEHRGISGFEIPLDEEVVEQARRHGLKFTHREFTHRRHSTLTCSQEEFENLDFTFRLVGFEPPRQIRIILFFTLSPLEDLLSFSKRWDFLLSSICHLQKQMKASMRNSWKDILVHVACSASLDRIDPSIRESLYKMGILNTPTAAIAGGKCRPFSTTPIQVVLTAYRNDSRFHMSIVETINAQTGWYHSLCALLGAGMIIEVPNEASKISERGFGYKHEEFLYDAWANERDISGIRTYNGITVTSPRLYLSMPLRDRPKPKVKDIIARILSRKDGFRLNEEES
ncbi:hypothetical protein B0J15DRAFT_407947 [Fusarium solani]|uniref:Azaphilone pigments biosynthesis cluster protein L N-terminal domain-containing protein n=1 Tax=Fusarium solani TaxID=169388 RepID=A0A9P9JZE7_FUSSL|nr:uncharacterized protein B0J15DRAFT_407947 [Fusarium solani]KAH7234464.1 hypothetical protein B0J15DRAFT_407947 [Fusarium solani]